MVYFIFSPMSRFNDKKLVWACACQSKEAFDSIIYQESDCILPLMWYERDQFHIV